MTAAPKKKILIVEDDEMVRSFVSIHLENQEFTVTGVATGKAFLAFFEKEPVDLIILDLNLPDGDGLEFAADFRKTNQTPIIIASARKGMDDRLTALNLGSIDYVTKPFDPQELYLRIKNLLHIAEGDLNDQEENSKTAYMPKKLISFGAAAAIVIFAAIGTLIWFQSSDAPVETANTTPTSNPEPNAPTTAPDSVAPAPSPPASMPEPPANTVTVENLDKDPIAAPQPVADANKCAELPDVSWWANKTHDSIVSYVAAKHAANWTPYIKNWETRLERLIDIMGRNSSAVASGGIVLSGAELQEYITKVEKRLEITKCLARNQFR